MIYLALGFAALALFLMGSRGRPVLKRREWRFLSGALAIAAFTGAAWVGVRGGWGAAIVLVVLGLAFAVSTRRPGIPISSATSRMSVAEARRILGVEEGASRSEIQAAYTRLMRLAHPDKGGTAGLAAQLNAARDRLLGK
ncbi:DnaJ domain-containing protein [Phenylobacterium sp. J426]|uniref:J domain-containing protein n=1 Tax=Phenylobacterium sp. J426 TaxID=2898439 RepID=UPI00215138F0|nr:DnaJ domain-containing protein [Phenylobacterium sp. J426]MCR5875430.1 DnaJ domain-containing protein [Phenylobacterium sp. J426]